MALTKHERWAKAKIPKTVHCVRLGDHFIGKIWMFKAHGRLSVVSKNA